MDHQILTKIQNIITMWEEVQRLNNYILQYFLVHNPHQYEEPL
jgi:hypothetical protein